MNPFATARLEGHEVVLTIGDEQIRYDNALNGYQSAHAIAEQVNAIQARDAIEPDPGATSDEDEPPTKTETPYAKRQSEPPPGKTAA